MLCDSDKIEKIKTILDKWNMVCVESYNEDMKIIREIFDIVFNE
jgi:hypothetical protein